MRISINTKVKMPLCPMDRNRKVEFAKQAVTGWQWLKDVTVGEVVRHLEGGRMICAAKLKNDKRGEGFWSTKTVILDFDLVTQPLDPRLKAFVKIGYFTPNHTSTAPRFRLILELESAIKDADEHTAVAKALAARFGADVNACDPMRIFFPGKPFLVQEDARLLSPSCGLIEWPTKKKPVSPGGRPTDEAVREADVRALIDEWPDTVEYSEWLKFVFSLSEVFGPWVFPLLQEKWPDDKNIEAIARRDLLPEKRVGYSTLMELVGAHCPPFTKCVEKHQKKLNKKDTPAKIFEAYRDRLEHLSFWDIGRDKPELIIVEVKDNKTVVPYYSEEEQLRALYGVLYNYEITYQRVKQILEHIRGVKEIWSPAKEFHIVMEESAPGLSLYRIPDIEPDMNPQIPAWREFLDRLSDPEAFAAWFWTVFDPMHRGRQILYVHSRGGAGKSAVLNALSTWLLTQGSRGIIQSMSSMQAFIASDRFSLSLLVNRRILCMNDIHAKDIAKYSKMKAITGGDTVLVEYKHGRSVELLLPLRVLIHTNYPPEPSMKEEELSRLLYIQVEREPEHQTVDWPDRLAAEAGDFLAYCKACYEARCIDGYKISSKSSAGYLKVFSNEAVEEELDFLNQFFVLGVGLKAPQEAVIWFKKKTMMNVKESKEFRDVLKSSGALLSCEDGVHFWKGLGLNPAYFECSPVSRVFAERFALGGFLLHTDLHKVCEQEGLNPEDMRMYFHLQNIEKDTLGWKGVQLTRGGLFE